MSTVEDFKNEPEPGWIDAPAVIATCEYCGAETFHTPIEGIRWKCTPLEYVRRWKCTKCRAKAKTSRELTNVTPLYPKGEEA